MTFDYSTKITTLLGYTNEAPNIVDTRDPIYTTASHYLVFPFNHRFQGPKESYKFKAVADTINLFISRSIPKLNANRTSFESAVTYLCGTEDDIAELYNIRAEVEFYEYLTSKLSTATWFN